jgi:nucleoside-diphosphate-sugar epimerase
MRALLTGATGYVGLYLAKKLAAEGWQVHGLVRQESETNRLLTMVPEIHLHNYDGSTETVCSALDSAQPDVLFHLASKTVASEHSVADVEPLLASNLLFGTQLLQAVSQHPSCLFINTGTFSQFDADGAANPNSLYGASKGAFQDIITYFSRYFGFSAVTLVLFDIYGPGDWRSKLLPALVEHIGREHKFPMTPGEQLIFPLHIDDVVAGYLQVVEMLKAGDIAPADHHMFSLDPGERITLRDLVKRLETLADTPLNTDWGAMAYRKNQIFNPVCPVDILPGWSPGVLLNSGLGQLLKEFKK